MTRFARANLLKLLSAVEHVLRAYDMQQVAQSSDKPEAFALAKFMVSATEAALAEAILNLKNDDETQPNNDN